jgi:hypothetical protein
MQWAHEDEPSTKLRLVAGGAARDEVSLSARAELAGDVLRVVALDADRTGLLPALAADG